MKRKLNIIESIAELYSRKRIPRASAALSYYLTMTFFPLVICLYTMLGSSYDRAVLLLGFVRGFISAETAGYLKGFLSYVAENEYRNIKQRQMEGIKAAKANGVKFGRPKIEVTEAFYVAAEKWRHGDVSMEQAAKEAGLSFTTFYRRLKVAKISKLRKENIQHKKSVS